MKRLFFIPFLFSSLLFGQTRTDFHSKAVFEENKGQVSNEIQDSRGELNPEIYFVVRGTALTYFFSDRGYSVVEQTKEGNISRIDFLFENNAKCIPVGLNQLASKNLHYSARGSFFANKFERIIYRNAFDGADMEFFIAGDWIEKKIIITNPEFYGRVSFDVRGSSQGAEETYNVNRQIDPGNDALTSTISWLTYIGGTSSDELFGITLTPDSGVVITGRTSSADFPVTPGAYQDSFALNYDVVITRFDKDGNCLWSTFYGGTNFDGGYQLISLDSVFVVAGMTNSTDLPMLYPTQANNGGSYDGFLIMLNDSGQLMRSTYYGGSGSDQGLAIAKGVNGEIVLAGSTTSTNLPFANAGYQGTMAGMIDAFVAVFDDSLNVLWSSYYGGTGVEDIHTVTVTPQNEIAFAGATRSFDFPVTPNAYQNGLLSQPDNYIVKFSMGGARLYATFFGGTNSEDANGIVGDEDGNLYLTGYTYSIDFPTAGTVFQPTLLGQNDIFVSRFDSTGQLVWSTFIGGGGQDVAWGMYRLGKYIFICGQTESAAFPVSANAIQSAYAANSDGFVIKMDTSGQMISGTFMGGNGVDALLGIVVDADTNVVSCGNSYSTNLVVTNPFQATNAGSGDGYVVKFGMSEELVGTIISFSDENNLLHVFPNPANDFVTVISEGNIISELEILDGAGRVVKRFNPESKTATINVNDLAQGFYFIKVIDETSQIHTLRLVIK